MKKYAFMLTACLAAAIFNTTFAQEVSVARVDPEFTHGRALNNISTRAVRDFHRTYREVFDEEWYSVINGYIAKFTRDNIKTRVDYDKHGNWLSTIRYMNERQMPRDLRNRVKSVYFDDRITQVEEIQNKEDKVYLIHLEGESTWKVVRVGEEMTVLEDYNKK
jgi:hypothetical protein